MVKELPFNDDWPPQNRPRGTWNYLTFPLKSGRRSAIFTCPSCGKIGTLVNHDISDSGYVNPSVSCYSPGCDFHDWIMLVGWDPDGP